MPLPPQQWSWSWLLTLTLTLFQILKKLIKKAKDGLQTPVQDLAFKVFDSQEEAAESSQQARLQQKAMLHAQALAGALRPMSFPQRDTWGSIKPHPTGARPKSIPPGASFKCGQGGHWAKNCPNPRPPTTLCPLCQQPGHWKSECPGTGLLSVPRHGGPAPLSQAPQSLPASEFLCLAED